MKPFILTYQFYVEDTDSYYIFNYELSDAEFEKILPKAVYAVMGMHMPFDNDYAEKLLKAFPRMKMDFLTVSELREVVFNVACQDSDIVENAENAFLDEYYKTRHGTLTKVNVTHKGQYVPAYMEYGINIDMQQVKGVNL